MQCFSQDKPCFNHNTPWISDNSPWKILNKAIIGVGHGYKNVYTPLEINTYIQITRPQAHNPSRKAGTLHRRTLRPLASGPSEKQNNTSKRRWHNKRSTRGTSSNRIPDPQRTTTKDASHPAGAASRFKKHPTRPTTEKDDRRQNTPDATTYRQCTSGLRHSKPKSMKTTKLQMHIGTRQPLATSQPQKQHRHRTSSPFLKKRIRYLAVLFPFYNFVGS